jgi:hypothetical protein
MGRKIDTGQVDWDREHLMKKENEEGKSGHFGWVWGRWVSFMAL